MIPKSISATALSVAEACPARYQAEHILRARGSGSVAANTGTAVHGALEDYVRVVYIDKTEAPNLTLLEMFFTKSYSNVFGSFDTETEEYEDGLELVRNWYNRTDLSEVRVISAEKKDFFEVPTSVGPIPFNYIWDRFDELRPGVFRVVDYKTNRWNITRDQLLKKVQARAYGLAAAIQLKAQGIEYEKIWVEFDLLRHESIGLVFTREDNLNFWNFLIRTVEEKIISIPDNNPPERLNPECLFCVRKAACKALQDNILVGGIHSIPSIEKGVDLRAQLEWQRKGLNALLDELDAKLLSEAKARDLEEVVSEDNILKIVVSSRRKVDPERVEMVLGPKLFEKYGSKSITLREVEKLLKGRELTPEQKAELRGLIYQQKGEPSIKIEPKNPIDSD